MSCKPRDVNREECRKDRGAVVAMVAIMMVVVVSLAALAIDLSHLMMVKNELQNAADAGALAGARVLYNEAGTAVNTGANQEAYDAATANKAVSTAGAIAVDANWSGGNNGDIQRGHWSFATKTFTPNNRVAPPNLEGKTAEELDADPDFINAVRVIARRDATKAASFFARIFGYEDFALSAEAVAYRSFAGTINPHEIDLPIVICKEAIVNDDGDYSCEYGRMLNSGNKPANVDDHNTGGWTDFSIQTICSGTNTNDMREVLNGCAGNPTAIPRGSYIGTSGGVADNLIDHEGANMPDVMNCWVNGRYDSDGDGEKDASVDTDNNGVPDQPWNVNLPVVECPNNNIGTCSKVVGSVNVNIVWMLEADNKIDRDAPYKMGGWSDPSPDGITRWNSFVNYFDLHTVDGDLATYENNGFKKKSIYFLPDCTPNEPSGVTGGENFGVIAKYPVLVK